MVQFQVLSGRKAGTVFLPHRLPCTIGRSGGSDLALDDSGVWDRHIEIHLDPGRGVLLRVIPPALGTLNAAPVETALLRSGDVIGAGTAQLRFWLSEARQPSLRWREALTWLGLAALCAAQLLLIYALIR